MYYTDFHFFSTFCPSCFYSSYWLYDEGKIKCTSHLSLLPCSAFRSVLDIGPTAHLAWYSTDTSVTDTGRLHLMVLFCLNWSPWCALDHVQHCCFSGRSSEWELQEKKWVCFVSGEGRFYVLKQFFLFQKVCFIVWFQILL